jgi:hypothetical protein
MLLFESADIQKLLVILEAQGRVSGPCFEDPARTTSKPGAPRALKGAFAGSSIPPRGRAAGSRMTEWGVA